MTRLWMGLVTVLAWYGLMILLGASAGVAARAFLWVLDL